MRAVLCCAMLYLVASAQDSAKSLAALTGALLTLRDARTSRTVAVQQITNEMMLLSGRDRAPLRSIVTVFADELAFALQGRDLTERQAAALAQPMADVVRGTVANFNSGTRFRQALKSMGIPMPRIETVTRRFIAIGEEVRGPDDVGARPQSLK